MPAALDVPAFETYPTAFTDHLSLLSRYAISSLLVPNDKPKIPFEQPEQPSHSPSSLRQALAVQFAKSFLPRKAFTIMESIVFSPLTPVAIKSR